MKVLNFGSLNIDYVYAVEHFVRAGETLASQSLAKNVGGKGTNQSAALAKAGAEVFHAGKIGGDGLFLSDFLAQCGVRTELITVSEEVSGHAIIQVDPSGQNCILLYGGANRTISREQIDAVLEHFAAGDILLLQNEVSNLAYMIELGAKKGLRIALNPSPISEELRALPLEKVHWFILNEIEGEALSGKKQPGEILDELLLRYPESRIVLTLGKQGCAYADAAQRFTLPAYHVKAVDTTAAGDTFTGYFLASVLRGSSEKEALCLATAASALSVTKPGAAASIPLLEEVTRFAAENPLLTD